MTSVVTPEFAADIDFGAARAAELIAIEQAGQPDEASDTRSLKDLVWWKDVFDVVLEATPVVLDFSVRVNGGLPDKEDAHVLLFERLPDAAAERRASEGGHAPGEGRGPRRELIPGAGAE
jgi:hypothetical protein